MVCEAVSACVTTSLGGAAHYYTQVIQTAHLLPIGTAFDALCDGQLQGLAAGSIAAGWDAITAMMPGLQLLRWPSGIIAAASDMMSCLSCCDNFKMLLLLLLLQLQRTAEAIASVQPRLAVDYRQQQLSHQGK